MKSYVNISVITVLGGFFLVALNDAAPASSAPSERWSTLAEWHRLAQKAVPGTLVLDDDGVDFHSAKVDQHWPYVEIHSFDLSSTELTLTSYQNRPRHEPGERRFHFTWSNPMPPEIASQFAERVGKPVRNGVPLPNVGVLSEIPAHRRMWSGGTNGIVRLKEDGVDYLTENRRGSRAWRWSDIQTLANPNPYELRVTAYRETVEFDLKQPMSRNLFELMWDRLYATGLNLSTAGGGAHR